MPVPGPPSLSYADAASSSYTYASSSPPLSEPPSFASLTWCGESRWSLAGTPSPLWEGFSAAVDATRAYTCVRSVRAEVPCMAAYTAVRKSSAESMRSHSCGSEKKQIATCDSAVRGSLCLEVRNRTNLAAW